MSLFLSGGARPQAVCSPDTPQPYIYNKVKTTNADIKRYKEQVMTRTKKDESEDLYNFSVKPTVGVCLPAQKSYKSEQIEQINNDKKNIWKIWKDLEDFSAKPTEKECVSRHRNPTNQDKSNK